MTGPIVPDLGNPTERVMVQCWCRGGYIEQTVTEWVSCVPPICDRDGCRPWGGK